MNGKPLSSRLRVTAPIAAAFAAAGHRLPTAAQDDQRGANRSESVLAELLSLVPATIVASPDVFQIAFFADIALQMETAGLPFPDSIDDEAALSDWIVATMPLLVTSPFRERALQLGRDVLGYDVTDLDQTLEVGDLPDAITVLRGRFDPNAISAAWLANGYELSSLSSVRAASLSKDGEIDLQNPIQQAVIGRMNNVALLDDSTIVYTRTWEMMEAVLAARSAAADSLAARVDVQRLLAAVDEPVVSVAVVGGSVFQGYEIPIDDSDMATAIARTTSSDDPLPPLATGLVALTPGGPFKIRQDATPIAADTEPARILYRVLMVQPGSAEEATPIVTQRLEDGTSVVTREPFSAFYGSWDVRPLEEGDILAIDFTLAPDRLPAIWIQPLYQRDLGFLAW